MKRKRFFEVKEEYRSVCRRTAFGVVCALILCIFASTAMASTASANANFKLTDGISASSNSSDSAWVVFNKDSTQLPVSLSGSPNLNYEFFGTGEYKNSNPAAETSVEQLMKDAGSRSVRLNLLWQVFSEPKASAPYWDWAWFDGTSDGQRILRAVYSGEMVDLVVNKTAFWAGKDLALTHPPESAAYSEQVTLNGTTPSQLSHTFLMGEKDYVHDKESVVGVNAATQAITNENIGSGNGSAFLELSLQHSAIVPGSLKLYVNGVQWNEVEFFRASNTLDKQAFVFFPNTGKVRFGDGWNGPILPSGANVTVSYSYYTNPFREYNGTTYNTTDQLDYRINYTNGTIQRTANSTIPSGSTVKITYYYLDTSTWQNFWKELTAHYSGEVKYFEVLNEENLDQSWTGTQAQYAEMLRAAYAGAKAGNPASEVLLGGLGWGTTDFSNLYSLNTKGAFDDAAWHPYGWQLSPDNPQCLFNALNNNYFSAVNANGDSSKPVFLNEVGFSTSQQVGMSYSAQGLALSRMYMMLLRNPRVVNASWWGVVDESPVGQQESELYISHLGLFSKNASGNISPKPAYYTFKSLGTNKGVIIDLASFDSSGNLTQGQYSVNKISFNGLGNDLSSANIFISQTNSNDWTQLGGVSMGVSQNAGSTYTYTINIPTVTARFIQIQFIKNSGATQFAIDEVKVFSTGGTNVALNKYYAAAGFVDDGAIYFSGPPNNPPAVSNPVPQFSYTIDKTNNQVILKNNTQPAQGATITGYLWYNNGTQISNLKDYSYSTSANTTLNIKLEVYYTGGASGYVQSASQTIYTGAGSTATNPTPAFTYTIDKVNKKVILKNQSAPGTGSTITGYLWFNNGVQISNSVDFDYYTTQNTDLNIELEVYYKGGAGGYVTSTFRTFNTGVWSTSLNPTPSFNYTIDAANNLLVLNNTTQSVAGATITGYLWFNNSIQISNLVNYSYPINSYTTYNICLSVYYTGGSSGWVQQNCNSIYSGKLSR